MDVLQAIQWMKQAWEDVSAATISNYFRHYGAIPDKDEYQSDPFADLDAAQSIANLNELVTQMDW